MSEQDEPQELGVRCGKCGGTVWMNTCPEHEWVLSSDCLDCGLHYDVGACMDCTARRLLSEEATHP